MDSEFPNIFNPRINRECNFLLKQFLNEKILNLLIWEYQEFHVNLYVNQIASVFHKDKNVKQKFVTRL